jgi:hypothetical protein
MLEYQAGIVFLTTNRILDFDKALFSRVHINIGYKPLLPSQRRFIWENMAKQTDHDFTVSDFDRLSQIPLDGRNIKNILRVASLHMKIRLQDINSPNVKIGITDVEAVLRYTVGDGGSDEVKDKVEQFYQQV